jgi:hypothetical protein
MLELTNPYFYHSFHCKVPTDFPIQYAQSQLQLKHYYLINFTLHATFIQLLKKLSILKGEQKFYVSSNRVTGRRPKSGEPHAVHGPRACTDLYY